MKRETTRKSSVGLALPELENRSPGLRPSPRWARAGALGSAGRDRPSPPVSAGPDRARGVGPRRGRAPTLSPHLPVQGPTGLQGGWGGFFSGVGKRDEDGGLAASETLIGLLLEIPPVPFCFCDNVIA